MILRPVLVASVLLASTLAQAQKQDAPPRLVPTPYIILESVVIEQWPATLPLVNVPANVTLLNPGQCIRVAALANGSGHEHFLDGATISFAVGFAGQRESIPDSAMAGIKQLKPEGMDFVTGALNAAGIKNPLKSFVTMGASQGRWCVPLSASDGTAVISATVTRNGAPIMLEPTRVAVESLATGAKKTFKDMKELSDFSQNYHVHPEPARLLPAFVYLVSQNQDSLIPFAFFRAAFLHDAPTVRGFGPGLAAAPKLAQMLALNLLAKSGVTLTDPPKLTPEDLKNIAASPDLPDPYQLKPDQQLPSMLDFLWSDFCATGRRQPVQTVVSGLAWQPDFAAFQEIQKSGKRPKELTPSIMRGVSFMAAGWSLRSFEHNDPLAADYLDAIATDPSVPSQLKAELSKLDTNPAFNRQ